MWWQHVLQSDVDDVRHCWLPRKLKVGQRLTLKERHGTGGSIWRVNHVYDIALPDPPETEWKVGGLS